MQSLDGKFTLRSFSFLFFCLSLLCSLAADFGEPDEAFAWPSSNIGLQPPQGFDFMEIADEQVQELRV